MRRKRHGIAMYIQPQEMAQRGYEQTAEGFAAYAREALLAEGMTADGMTLEVFSGAGGIMMFCEPHERALARFSEFEYMLLAAQAVSGDPPARSALWYGENGAWYLEMRDEHERVLAAAALACEYGEPSDRPSVWLDEHAKCVERRRAVELLAELA